MKQIRFHGWMVVPVLGMAVILMAGRNYETKSPEPPARTSKPRHTNSGDFRAGFRDVAGEENFIHRDAGLAKIAGRWIAVDPGEALDFTLRQPAGEIRDTFMRRLLVAWAGRDAAAAMDWSDGLADVSERRDTRSVIAIALAEADPRGAIELAIRHGADEDETGGLLENLAMQWAERESNEALAWVITQPDEEWRDRLLARVAFILAKSDPHGAACHVAEDMEPGPMQDEAVISVLHQWAMQDAESAAKWVETGVPEGRLRERALAELSQAVSLIR